MAENIECLELKPITPLELFEPQDLGSIDKAENDGFSVRVNDAPLPIPIDARDHAPPELKHWMKRFDIWAVPHRISIIRVRGSREVMSCGLDVEFDAGKKTCSILALFPTPRHVVRAEGALGFQAVGMLTASGQFELDNGSKHSAVVEMPQAVGAGALKIDGGIGIRFSTRLCTPYIAAAGVGSRHCEFKFDYESEPLHGKDIECWSVLALSRQVTEVKMNLRYYLTTRQAFMTRRYEGSKNDLIVSVQK